MPGAGGRRRLDLQVLAGVLLAGELVQSGEHPVGHVTGNSRSRACVMTRPAIARKSVSAVIVACGAAAGRPAMSRRRFPLTPNVGCRLSSLSRTTLYANHARRSR